MQMLSRVTNRFFSWRLSHDPRTGNVVLADFGSGNTSLEYGHGSRVEAVGGSRERNRVR